MALKDILEKIRARTPSKGLGLRIGGTGFFTPVAAKPIFDFAKEIVRATPRAATSVITSLRGEKEFVPVTKAQKTVLGERPILAVGERQKEDCV